MDIPRAYIIVEGPGVIELAIVSANIQGRVEDWQLLSDRHFFVHDHIIQHPQSIFCTASFRKLLGPNRPCMGIESLRYGLDTLLNCLHLRHSVRRPRRGDFLFLNAKNQFIKSGWAIATFSFPSVFDASASESERANASCS